MAQTFTGGSITEIGPRSTAPESKNGDPPLWVATVAMAEEDYR